MEEGAAKSLDVEKSVLISICQFLHSCGQEDPGNLEACTCDELLDYIKKVLVKAGINDELTSNDALIAALDKFAATGFIPEPLKQMLMKMLIIMSGKDISTLHSPFGAIPECNDSLKEEFRNMLKEAFNKKSKIDISSFTTLIKDTVEKVKDNALTIPDCIVEALKSVDKCKEEIKDCKGEIKEESLELPEGIKHALKHLDSELMNIGDQCDGDYSKLKTVIKDFLKDKYKIDKCDNTEKETISKEEEKACEDKERVKDTDKKLGDFRQFINNGIETFISNVAKTMSQSTTAEEPKSTDETVSSQPQDGIEINVDLNNLIKLFGGAQQGECSTAGVVQPKDTEWLKNLLMPIISTISDKVIAKCNEEKPQLTIMHIVKFSN